MIVYNDSKVKTLDMFKDLLRYEPDNVLHPSDETFEQTLWSNEGAVMTDMLNVFGNEPIMLHLAQSVDQPHLVDA